MDGGSYPQLCCLIAIKTNYVLFIVTFCIIPLVVVEEKMFMQMHLLIR